MSLEQQGIDTIDYFLETWNSRDVNLWAGSLNYPHVRPAPSGPVAIAETAESYAAGFSYQSVIESGWDHSEWDYQHVLHTSPSRIHVAGQWSRYSKAGEVIMSTPIVYVCTQVDGKWGIQSRFCVDHVDEDTDTTQLMTRGLQLVQDYVNHQSSGNRDACAEMLNYPHFNIGVGELDITWNAQGFNLPEARVLTESLIALQTGKHAMNVAMDLQIEGLGLRQAVVNINQRNAHLGIHAWSLLDPNESEPEQ